LYFVTDKLHDRPKSMTQYQYNPDNFALSDTPTHNSGSLKTKEAVLNMRSLGGAGEGNGY
jgi:hypothetical protein